MQPCHWLKTHKKKKNMELTETDSQKESNLLFPFDQISTSKKSRPILNQFMVPIPMRLSAQPQIFQTPKNKLQNKNRLQTGSTQETSIDLSLEKIKVSSCTESVREQFYDPDQMLIFLNQAYNSQEKLDELTNEPQISSQNEFDDRSEIDDRISIFTFGPILIQENLSQSLEEESLMTDKLGYINNDQPTQIAQNIEKQAQSIRNQNPLLHLKPSDFNLLNSSDVNYELFFAKRNDPFLKNYFQKKYEPQKEELRSQIKQEMSDLMRVKEGKYLTNIILTEVLEEILNLDKLEQEVDEQIQKCEAKLQKSLSSSFSKSKSANSYGSVEFCRLQRHLDIEEMSITNYLGLSSNKISQNQCQSNRYTEILEQKGSLDHQEIINETQIKLSLENTDEQLSLKSSGSSLKQLDEQIQAIETKISKQESNLKQSIEQEGELEILEQNFQKELNEIENYKNFIGEEIQSLKQKLSQSNQVITSDMKKEQLQSNYRSGQIQKITQSNQQKLKELLEHLYDVFYIELQILSNKLLKNSMDRKKLKLNPETDKYQLQQSIMNEFYNALLKSIILEKNIQNFKAVQKIDVFSDKSSYQKLKFEDLLDFYSKIEAFLKIYFCFKIKESQRSQVLKKEKDSNLVQNLFKLFDTNSYHSQALKQTFFSFYSQFLSYGQRIFALLFEQLNEHECDFHKRKESLQIKKEQISFGRSSYESKIRRSTKRKEKRTNQQKDIDTIISILKQFDASEQTCQSIKELVQIAIN